MSMFDLSRVSVEISGSEISFETGKLAKQASGAVVVRAGDTMVLCTATAGGLRDVDFLPLTVDVEERHYAAGKIPGSFFRREGRPGEKGILTARMIDRPLRPLFPKGWHYETQLVCQPLSAEHDHPYDILAMNGASAALAVSHIPVTAHVGSVRIGKLDGDFVINPPEESYENLEMDLVVAGTDDAILMVECGAGGVGEAEILDALDIAHGEIKKLCGAMEELREKAGKPKQEVEEVELDEALVAEVQGSHGDALVQATQTPEKLARQDEVRPIECEIDLLPRVHGSALFTRGETQILSNIALGTTRMDMRVDDLSLRETKRFFHHYNFPPFSVGEAGFMRGPKRRDIGHGALAERALVPVIPPEEDFPYVIRVVSDTLESNGSSSMGSVCASSMALMAAGIPVPEAVAGVAMGLIKEGDDHVVLTDIAGVEDHLGDMDFKVAGTADGITALQMDPDKIGALIGKGGETIRALSEEFEAEIDVDDDGTVRVYAASGELVDACVDRILSMTKEAEVGDRFTGKVVKTTAFGAFIELTKGTDGLLHISNVRPGERVASVDDVLKTGDELDVTVVEVDRERGRIGLRLSSDPEVEGKAAEELTEVGTGDRGPRRGSDGGGRGRGRDGRSRSRPSDGGRRRQGRR